jgi:DNA repair exonuclease SbcCD ATPase subunit
VIYKSLTMRSISRALKERTIHLDFPAAPGVYAWIGPNGAGKTHALEACLPGALYRTFPSYSSSDVKAHAVGRDAMIEVRFSRGGSDAIERVIVEADPAVDGGRGKVEAYWLREEGERDVACAGPLLGAVDAYRDTIFPSLNVILAGPFRVQRKKRSQPGTLFDGSQGDRRQLFVELLGINELLEKGSSYKTQALGLEGQVEKLRAEISAGAASLERVTDCKKNIEDLFARVQEEEGFLEAARVAEIRCQQAIRDVEAEAKSTYEAVADLNARARAFVDQRKTRQAELSSIDEELAELASAGENPDPTGERVVELRAELADLREKHRGKTELATAAREELDVVERTRLELRGKIESAEATIARAVKAEASIATVDMKRKICQSCELTKDARIATEAKAGAQENMKAWRLDQMQYGERAKELRADPAALEASEILERFSAVSREIERILEWKGNATDRPRLEQRRAELAQAEEASQETARALRIERDEATAANDTATLSQVAAAAELTAARAAVQMLNERLSDDRAELRRYEQALAELGDVDGAELERMRDRLQEREHELALVVMLAKGFGPLGIAALRIDAAGPAVSAIANQMIDETGGSPFALRLVTSKELARKRGTREVFECEIVGADGVNQNEGSPGEMVRVEEALSLAVSIHMSDVGCLEPIQTIFRDEAAGALDFDAAARYVELLRAAHRIGKFHQVHFIAHQPVVWRAVDGLFVFEPDRDVRFTSDVASEVDRLQGGWNNGS